MASSAYQAYAGEGVVYSEAHIMLKDNVTLADNHNRSPTCVQICVLGVWALIYQEGRVDTLEGRTLR